MSSLTARLVGAFLLGLPCAHALAQEIVVRPDRESGIYQAGERARWNLELKGDAASLGEVRYRVKAGGLNAAQEGVVKFSEGKASIEADSKEAGWLLLEVESKTTGGKAVRAHGGALFSPTEIRPAAARPKDFDAFWKAKLRELSKVPINAVLAPGDSGNASVEYWTISMDNIRGSKINGQLAKPKGEGKFPALLIVQWAGVYPLEKGWAVGRAMEGWLTLNIQAHDLPVAEPAAFYRAQSDGPLNNYPAIGNEDRETSYFLRMYLSCYRAAEYLTKRKDWNGKVLVVTGGSQGGLQAIVTAAIHPKITGAVADVPAGCDNASLDANRAPGWPMWPYQTRGKDAAKVKATGGYYDVVNFAPMVKCPVFVGVGGIDTVCPPPGVFAAYNLFRGPKEYVFMPQADHTGGHDAYYARSNAWFMALKAGAAKPPK